MLGIALIVACVLSAILVLWATVTMGEGYESGDGGGE